MPDFAIYAIIDYEDEYVQPLILSALRNRLPPEVLNLISSISELPSSSAKVLQWRQYETVDFDHLLTHPQSCLANSYVIRKALIRKHYLSTTVSHWLAKHPDSILTNHVKPSVEFEVDYADFLDDALVEAWDLKESWARNEAKVTEDWGVGKEWWILKPGMSDRGQGIRLFSSEEELEAIFEDWDPNSEDEDVEDDEIDATNCVSNGVDRIAGHANGIVTSHLRHFIAQPYIHPPLLLPEPHPCAGRKFHIRTYVLAVGALRVFVYKPMLALFAGSAYVAPDFSANDGLSSHLTNTCLQTGEREGSVHAFWSLPPDFQPPSTARDWREDVFSQICSTTSTVFLAAARSMGTHFQPLPNAFELFALDFLLDQQATAWLLEVNAFPDFKQTGEELKGLVEGLFESVVDMSVRPFLGLEYGKVVGEEVHDEKAMVEVLDVDLGRR